MNKITYNYIIRQCFWIPSNSFWICLIQDVNTFPIYASLKTSMQLYFYICLIKDNNAFVLSKASDVPREPSLVLCLIIYHSPTPICIVYYNWVLMCTDVKLLPYFLYDEYNWYIRKSFRRRQRLSLYTLKLSEHLHNLLSLKRHAVYFLLFYI